MDSWMVSKNYMLFTFGQPKKSKVLNIKIHICIFNLANLFFIVCKFIHLGMTRMGSDCPNALPSQHFRPGLTAHSSLCQVRSVLDPRQCTA